MKITAVETIRLREFGNLIWVRIHKLLGKDSLQIEVARITRKPGTSYPVLALNLKGFEAALTAGAQKVAVFAAASESFAQKNTNCSIAESLERFAPVMKAARASGVKVRGY